MAVYLKHHLEIAGIHEQLFSDEAILAIHQGSGGLLRRANRLAKGSLLGAAREKCMENITLVSLCAVARTAILQMNLSFLLLI